MDYSPTRLLCPWRFSRQEQRSGLPLGECSLGTSLAFFPGHPPSGKQTQPASTWTTQAARLGVKSWSHLGFPGGLSGKKNPPANPGDWGSIPGSGRSPGGGHGNPPQCSCLENPMDRGAWRAAVHGVTKSQTRLSDSAQHSTCVFHHNLKGKFLLPEINMRGRVWSRWMRV